MKKKLERKKNIIDGMDREMLRHLYYNKRPLNGFQLSKKINLSPTSTSLRLANLKKMGILKLVEIQGIRSFNRKIKGRKTPMKIKSPRSIFWGINLKDDIKKEKKEFFDS